MDTSPNDLHGKRIALVATVPYMMSQLSAHIQLLRSLGMHVTLITSPEDGFDAWDEDDNLSVIALEIPRKLLPWRDFKALIRLFLLFRSGHFSIVHSTTPKAGLLCAIAGRLASIPVRLHTFTGQAWLTRKGLLRAVMRFSDRVVVQLSTHCYADSPSQRQLLIDEEIALPQQLSVLGKGSLAGVDLQRFCADNMQTNECQKTVREDIGIAERAFVITYIGRITDDKGLNECLAAFGRLQQVYANVELLLIGPTDGCDGQDIISRARKIPHVHYLGYQSKPEDFLVCSDLLCLPSYREGFGTVVIESAAMGVPCVGSRIPGLVDAIEDGVSGLLVNVKDARDLFLSLERLLLDRQLLKTLSIQAQQRCKREFSSTIVNGLVCSEYAKWLKIMNQ